MDGLAVFSLFSFVFSLGLYSRVKRLERILRENGIRPKGAMALGGRLQQEIGSTLFLTLGDMETDGSVLYCKILDVDEEWALLLLDEGKKREREQLVRLDSVRKVKGGKGT